MAHEYNDADVQKTINHASWGNKDIEEIVFKKPVEAFNIHKKDVIHLAKIFGLHVYEGDSKL